MRTIKFRMWNPEGKKYLYDIDNVYECLKQQLAFDKTQENRFCVVPYNHKENGVVWEQFTGLTDKNGIDIYEGDVLKRYHKFDDGGMNIHLGVITWDDCHFYSKSIKNEISRSLGNKAECVDYEVIGNIHQNPELLCQK